MYCSAELIVAMASFKGFDDEDERPVSNGLVLELDENREAKAIDIYKERRSAKVSQTGVRSKSVRSKNTDAVPKEALLSAPPPVETTECNQRVENPDIIQNIKVAPNEDVDEEVPSENTIPEERTSATLQSLEERRKKVEEENRRKKRVLAKAIAERQQKTTAENERLSHAQDELSRIDAGLTSDVSFLRDSIETASITFMAAQKRYDKAEKEFVTAKTKLNEAAERKGMLAEHLATIIEKNEERKARKLEELLKELNIDEDV